QAHAGGGLNAAADVDDVVGDRLLAAVQGGETGVGGDVRRVAALEQDALRRQAVDEGADRLWVAVAAEVVEALRIQRDQDDVQGVLLLGDVGEGEHRWEGEAEGGECRRPPTTLALP